MSISRSTPTQYRLLKHLSSLLSAFRAGAYARIIFIVHFFWAVLRWQEASRGKRMLQLQIGETPFFFIIDLTSPFFCCLIRRLTQETYTPLMQLVPLSSCLTDFVPILSNCYRKIVTVKVKYPMRYPLNILWNILRVKYLLLQKISSVWTLWNATQIVVRLQFRSFLSFASRCGT